MYSTPELVKVTPMSRATVPPGTFTAFKDVDGRWVKEEISQDYLILDSKLGAKGSPAGLVSKIPTGKVRTPSRSTSRPASRGSSCPDHRVDVIQVSNTGV